MRAIFIISRKTLLLSIISLLVGICLDAQTKIAILPFSGFADTSSTDTLTLSFTMAMMNSGKYTVYERMALEKAMDELDLQRTPNFDETTATTIGKLIGIKMMFFGNVSSARDQYIIIVRCVDIETGEVKYIKKGECNVRNDLDLLAEKMANEIASGDTKTITQIISLTEEQKESIYQAKAYDNAINDRYHKKLASGIALVSIGGVLLTTGIILTSVGAFYFDKFFYNNIEYYDNTAYYDEMILSGTSLSIGILAIIPGCILIPISAVPFYKAYRLHSQLMSFLQRSSICGGYDWDKKEVTVAMAIRL